MPTEITQRQSLLSSQMPGKDGDFVSADAIYFAAQSVTKDL